MLENVQKIAIFLLLILYEQMESQEIETRKKERNKNKNIRQLNNYLNMIEKEITVYMYCTIEEALLNVCKQHYEQ